MRAGYLAVALALLGALALTVALGLVGEPPPPTVETALGLDGPDPPALEAARAAAAARRTSSCMRARGWVYPDVAAPALVIPDAALDPITWADRWGFGVSTAALWPRPILPPDPRTAAVARIEPLRRTAFLAALDGDDEQPGCSTIAAAAVYGTRERALAPLHADLTRLESAIESDPRARDVTDAWRDCVAVAVDRGGLAIADLDRGRLPGRLIATFGARLAHAANDAAALTALRATERSVAGLLARCEATYVAAMAVVADPHERAFVLTHRRALARVRDRLEAERRQLLEVASSGG